jgi:hypothetical protein
MRGTDIGDGHRVKFYTSGDDSTPIGLIAFHSNALGALCSGGSVLFDVPANAHAPDDVRWQVISLQPLTLSPSLLCLLCGDHGWIREGAWLRA